MTIEILDEGLFSIAEPNFFVCGSFCTPICFKVPK